MCRSDPIQICILTARAAPYQDTACAQLNRGHLLRWPACNPCEESLHLAPATNLLDLQVLERMVHGCHTAGRVYGSPELAVIVSVSCSSGCIYVNVQLSPLTTDLLFVFRRMWYIGGMRSLAPGAIGNMPELQYMWVVCVQSRHA